MRKLATLAAVGVLAVATANCSNAREGANSANGMFPSTDIVAPSSLEARAPGSNNGNGKGGNNNNQAGAGGGSSLDVVLVNDVGTAGYSWGDTVTFVVSTSASNPNVELICSQNGVAVYGTVWPLTPNPTLSSGMWQGGAAECTANLYQLGDRRSILATVTFSAGA